MDWLLQGTITEIIGLLIPLIGGVVLAAIKKRGASWAKPWAEPALYGLGGFLSLRLLLSQRADAVSVSIALVFLLGVVLLSRKNYPIAPAIVEQPAYKPKPGLETTTFNTMRTELENLAWSQRIAICLTWKRPYITASQLGIELRSLGFGRNVEDEIITPVERLELFVKVYKDGTLGPNRENKEIANLLLEEFKRSIPNL
jgi:hypothetical protein